MSSVERTAGLCSWCYSLILVCCSRLLADRGTGWGSAAAPQTLRTSSAPAPRRWGPAGPTGRRCSGWWGAVSRSWSGSVRLVPQRVEGVTWDDAWLLSDPSSSASPSRWLSGASSLDTWTWISLWWRWLWRIWSRAESASLGQEEALPGCWRWNSPKRLVCSRQAGGRWGRSRRSPQKRSETSCFQRWSNQGPGLDHRPKDHETCPAGIRSQTGKSSPGAGEESSRTPP